MDWSTELHRFDHAEAPPLRTMQRDVTVARELQPEKIAIFVGLIDDDDARVAAHREVDALPQSDLVGIVDAATGSAS